MSSVDITTYLGSETLVDAIIAKLQANMPAVVNAINLATADGVTIAAPDNSRYFAAMRRTIAPPGPAIFVMDGRMTLDPRQEGPHSLMTSTKIGVWVMEEDADEDHLARKMLRQARAIILCLWGGAPQERLSDGVGNPIAHRLRPEGTVPGKPFNPEQEGPNLRQYYLTIFDVTRLEQ